MPESLSESLLHGAAERYQRFARLFGVLGDVGDAVNRILDEEGEKMKVREGADQPLSALMGPLLGKAMKTSQATERLCVLGFGEDAAVLLRSNVNLLINVAYIVKDEHPNDRMNEFLAYSWMEFQKFMRDGGKNVGAEKLPFPSEMLSELAKRWRTKSIEERAKRLPEHHYKVGYRFYSSIEHSDALAAGGYITEWGESGPRIGSGPSDSHVEVVLMHTADVLASTLGIACEYWRIDRPDVFDAVSALFTKFMESEKQRQVT